MLKTISRIFWGFATFALFALMSLVLAAWGFSVASLPNSEGAVYSCGLVSVCFLVAGIVAAFDVATPGR